MSNVIMPYSTLMDGAEDLARIGTAAENAVRMRCGITLVRNDSHELVTVYPDTHVEFLAVQYQSVTEWIGNPS